MKFSRSKRGFTLIELLVVISIISLLAAIIFANVSAARARARDSVRKAQLKTLQTALEAYYVDHNAYPSTGGSNNWYSSEPGNNANAPYGPGNNGDWIPGLVAGGYIPQLPHDPLMGKGDNNPNKCSGWATGGPWIGAYDYTSNGADYKIISHCAPEFMIGNRHDTPDSGFYDPLRYDHAIMVCSGEPACSSW
jgi:type II secretion system protein G